jgi:hypothetical protein
MKRPPESIVIAFCATCGSIGAAAKPSQKGTIAEECPFCIASTVQKFRYDLRRPR